MWTFNQYHCSKGTVGTPSMFIKLILRGRYTLDVLKNKVFLFFFNECIVLENRATGRKITILSPFSSDLRIFQQCWLWPTSCVGQILWQHCQKSKQNRIYKVLMSTPMLKGEESNYTIRKVSDYQGCQILAKRVVVSVIPVIFYIHYLKKLSIFKIWYIA